MVKSNNFYGERIMRVGKTIICFAATALLGCTGKTAGINDYWFGNYTVNINYGQLDEFSSVFIGYSIEVYRDRCVFFGLGYQTDFEDLCDAVEENADILHLMYRKTIGGSENHLPIDTLATLIKDGRQYYIKSRLIYNADAEFNQKIPLNKGE